MFLTHFKLTSQPFAERIAAEALWQDDRMRQGVARLRYLAEQATVGLHGRQSEQRFLEPFPLCHHGKGLLLRERRRPVAPPLGQNHTSLSMRPFFPDA